MTARTGGAGHEEELMTERPVAILKNRLYVPKSMVTDEDLEAFTYTLQDYTSQDPVVVRTYKPFSNDLYGFARGDMGKIQKIFGERFEIKDERAVVPHGYPLKFTGKLRKDQIRVWEKWFEHKYGLIKCPPRFGKCIKGDSLVMTTGGMFEIQDLFCATDPATSDCTTEVATLGGSSPTSHKHRRGKQETKTITTYSGFTICGTHEHPVLVLTSDLKLEWIPLEDIKTDKHHVAVSRNTQMFSTSDVKLNFKPTEDRKKTYHTDYRLPSEVTPELAKLLGYLCSEGSLNHDQIIISNKDSYIIEDFRKSFHSVFGVYPPHESVDKSRLVSLGSSANQILDFMRHVGVARCKSEDKDVPWCILRSSRSVISAFLQAYFDGDGCANKGSIEAVSASSKLIRQLQILLANFDIISRVTQKFVAGPTSGVVRPHYRLIITGSNIDRFHQHVGFGIRYKNKFKTIKRKHDGSQVIPHLAEALRGFMAKHRAGSKGSGWYVCSDGVKRHLSMGPFNSHSARDWISAEYFAKYSYVLENIRLIDPEFADKVASVLDKNIMWDKVVSVEPTGLQDVYDLTVPDTSSFVANSIIVHNTVLSVSLMCKLRQRTLVLAHESGILQQFEDSFRKFTNVNELEKEYGVKLCGQLKNYDDVFPILTCATWQMFNQPGAVDALKNNRDAFGLMVIDEAHACAAPCFSKIVSNFNPYYRVPLTATDKRKDGFEVVVSDIAGPVTAEGTSEQLPVLITVMWTNYEIKHFADWNGLWSQLCKDERRNRFIVKNVIQDVKDGHSCIVFTDRRAHAYDLKRLISEEDPDLEHQTEILIGGSPKTSIRDSARSGDTKIVIASPKIVQLGWDVPRWSSLHNTLPMANEPNWYQRISRIRTPCANCPGVGEDGCLKEGTCEKLQPVGRIYADGGPNKVTYSCLAVMNRVHKKLNFEVKNVKPSSPSSKSTTRAKKWGEVS